MLTFTVRKIYGQPLSAVDAANGTVDKTVIAIGNGLDGKGWDDWDIGTVKSWLGRLGTVNVMRETVTLDFHEPSLWHIEHAQVVFVYIVKSCMI